jgi:hypothetical protein
VFGDVVDGHWFLRGACCVDAKLDVDAAASTSNSISVVEFGEHSGHNRFQFWHMNRCNFPELLVSEPLVFVSQDIADADDGRPGCISISGQETGGNARAASETICAARSTVRRCI